MIYAVTRRWIDPGLGDDTADRLLWDFIAAEDARLEPLEKSGQKRRAEINAKLEAVRPEFEELHRAFGSVQRAAQILAQRHPELGIEAHAIRKRFGTRLPK